jgi:hypothetical protein
MKSVSKIIVMFISIYRHPLHTAIPYISPQIVVKKDWLSIGV